MRVAIYARYSTDNQRDASIEDQIRECDRYAASRGWVVVHRYSDHAMSGKVRLRPDFQALIKAASENRFDVVLAEALDRLSRSLQDTAALFNQFQFYGVRIVTLAEGEINMLAVGFKGTMNALYAADSADKTRRGMRGKVLQGKSGGGLCYGYRVEAAGGRSIHEQEAEIVRRIFGEYADRGLSPKSIAKRLNSDGVPGPRGSWGPSTINGHVVRGTGVLNNELYVGRLVWNRLHYVLHPITRRRVPRFNSEADRVSVSVPHLQIVTDALWNAAKERQGDLRKRMIAAPSIGVTNRPRYLFSGLTRCGECGHGYTMYSSHLLACTGARDRGVCSNRLTIRRERVEERVLNAMYLKLLDDEKAAYYCSEFEAAFKELKDTESTRNRVIDQRLAALARDKDRMIQAILAGVKPEHFKANLDANESERVQLEAQRVPALTFTRVPSKSELLGRYRAQIWMLREALEQADGRDAASERLRDYVSEIRLVPENGMLGIKVKANTANVLAAGGLIISSRDGCGGGI